MILIESIVLGIWATLFMDSFAKILSTRKLVYPFITPEELGRWFIYLFMGKITHKDIRKSPPVKNEKKWYLVSHYLIGIFLAGFYLLLRSISKEVNENVWLAFVFGIFTVILPWFWLLPSIGRGIMANKSAKQSKIIQTNLINHTNFGIGLFTWIFFVHNILL